MRCNNCGWDNPDKNSKCEKCGTGLSGSAHQSNERPAARDFNPNKTVCENEIFGSSKRDFQELKSSCSECGYPIREDNKLCPNCSNPVNEERSNNRQTKRDANPPKEKKAGGTIPWWEMAGNTPSCSLALLPRENEKTNRTEISFNGDAIILNRDNTEQSNQTITSQEQAMLTYENNKWYIQDKSSLKTTYVHAGEKREIKTGDVIVMGNRRFEFKN